MTVAELRRILAQCKPESEVLIRLDDAFFENPNGNIAEVLGHEYSYSCTDSLALMLECGQSESEGPVMSQKHSAPTTLLSRQMEILSPACYRKFGQQVKDLEHKLENAEEDSRRLNWLQHAGDIVSIRIDPDLEGSPSILWNAFPTFGLWLRGPKSLREAIDAVIQRANAGTSQPVETGEEST